MRVAIAFALAFGLIAVVAVFSYSAAFNAGNAAEQAIKYEWENNRNILAQYGQRVQEAAQVPGMQRDDLVAIFTGALEARYGKDGADATLLWLQEQNPNLDQQTYIQLQRIIEAGRVEFQTAQTKLLDRKRAYETQLGSLWRGMWLRIAGYPRIDLDQYRVVTSARADDAFQRGQEEPIQLRPTPR